MLLDDAVLMINGIPSFAAALAALHSPSSMKIPWTPMGAIMIGEESFWPKIVTY
jgi:hypothetical protein